MDPRRGDKAAKIREESSARSADMVIDHLTKRLLKRLAQLVRDFAKSRGWKDADYSVYFDPNLDWGHIGIILVLPRITDKESEKLWFALEQYFDEKLSDEKDLRRAVGATIFSADSGFAKNIAS